MASYGTVMIGRLADGVAIEDWMRGVQEWQEARQVVGFQGEYTFLGDDGRLVSCVIFESKDSYLALANDPEQDSPISGMPILNVEAAGRVIFIKRSLSPGFAGVDNPLFYDTEKTMMLFSDAKQGLQDVTSALKGA